MFVTKTIAIPSRKPQQPNSVNIGHDSDSHTLEPRYSIKEEVTRSNYIKNMLHEEEKKRMDNFINKFNQFIPASLSSKKQLKKKDMSRFDMIEESINNEDPISPLNIMLENKKKIELEKIKKGVQDSTEIAKR